MKRGYFASLAFAVLACISFTGNAFMRIAEVVVVTSRALKNWVFDGFTLAAAHSADKQRPQIKRMIAKAFVLRLIKRERPVVTACWRSCPST